MKLVQLLMMTAAMSTAMPTFALPVSQNLVSTMRFNDLAQQCSSGVHPNTLQAVARVESKFNPYAIGVVKGSFKRQPRTHAEAVATAKSLHAQGKNFSMGLMQVNRYNLATYGLTYETVFEPCKNINAGAKILKDCFDRAGGQNQMALKKAFSCYYSGNFRFGFKSDFKGQPPYVSKVIMAAMDNSPHQTINFSGSLKAGNSRSEQYSLMKASYVPQPSTQTNRQSATYIPMPQQAEQLNEVTDGNNAAVVTVKQEWDIFQEF